MPRKAVGEKLEKVVSTKLSAEDFMLIEKYARIAYNHNMIRQPTISHMLRSIVQCWAILVRESEREDKGKSAIHILGPKQR